MHRQWHEKRDEQNKYEIQKTHTHTLTMNREIHANGTIIQAAQQMYD